MRIFDCFLFFNELDLLELRLRMLYEHVDYFVIVESAQTFQGEEKEFIFEKNKNRFLEFSNKIIYYKVNKYSLNFADLPYIKDPKCIDDQILNRIYRFIDDCPHFNKEKEFWWGNDFYQRECIWRALALAEPNNDDLILISDLDEIPNIITIKQIKTDITPNSLYCLKQHEFCYFLNYYHNSNWLGTCCFLFENFSKISLNAIRFSAKRDEGLFPHILNNAGWHFTSLGNIDSIKKKITAWGHKELNTSVILKGIEYNVKHGYDIFRRPGFGKLQYLQLDNNILPSLLINYSEKYKNLIGPVIIQENIFQRIVQSFYFKITSSLYKIFK
jgi:beta-1,4-mannosyl-glycoprotein beta-1,4-N-acetylglucosaminyltransferase